MESVLVPLKCKIFNPYYEKMKWIDFLSDHDESSRSVQIMSIRQHWIPQVNAYLCVVYFCDLSTLNTSSQRLSMYCLLLVIDSRWDRSTFLMTSRVDPCESCRFVNIFYLCILHNILKMDFWPFHALHALEIKPGYCCKDLCLDNKGVSRSKMVNDWKIQHYTNVFQYLETEGKLRMMCDPRNR